MAKGDSITITPVIRKYSAAGITEHRPPVRGKGELYEHKDVVSEDEERKILKKRLQAEARRNRASQKEPKRYCR